MFEAKMLRKWFKPNKQTNKQTNQPTNQLTPSSWVFLEKPPVFCPVESFPTCYGTRSFITVFTKARHWSLSWAKWIQSVPPYPIYLRSILILSSYLRLSFWISHGSPICITFLSHACNMPCPSRPPSLDHSSYIWRRVQVMKLLIMQFCPNIL
jgi:hypothetical protein